MEQGTILPSPDLINNAWLEIDIERAGDVFPAAGLREESGKAIIVGGRRALKETPVGL